MKAARDLRPFASMLKTLEDEFGKRNQVFQHMALMEKVH